MKKENFKQLIKEREFTCTRLGNHLKISRVTVSCWCRGRSMPNGRILIEMAKELGVSIDRIVKALEQSRIENLQKLSR